MLLLTLAAVRLSAQQIPNGTYYIKAANGKYLGIAGVDKNNGAPLIQWDFATLDNHKFEIENQPDGSIFIKAVHSGRYLNVAGQSRDANAFIIQWDFVNQGNLKFWLTSNISGNGTYAVQCEQSRMYWNTHGGNEIAENGRGIVQYPGAMQWFSFEPVNGLLYTREKHKIPPGTFRTSFEFDVPGGGKVNRTLNPPIYANRTADTKSPPKLVREDENCRTYSAKVSSVEKNEVMTISNGNLIEYFAPGLVYDVRDLFNGTLINNEKFPYGQGRLPVQLTTTVRNFDGSDRSVQETVARPDRATLNQAIANFYSRHTSQAERTSMQNMRYYSCAITNSSEFALKVGVGGHYAFFSAQAGMEIKNARDYKTLYFEATKELFTLSARPATEAGFFDVAPADADKLGYISSVTYGLRIIAKVEVENIQNSLQADLKAAFEAGIAGVDVSLNSYTANRTSKTIVTLYAVGGRSDRIGTCTVDNIEATIQNFLLSANYQVAQPIKLQFSTLSGSVMRFMDATDDFTYELCEPKVIADESVTTITLHEPLITATNPETDYDFYGKIWVEAFTGANQPIRDNGNNHLMNVDGLQEIDLDNKVTFTPGTQVSFTYPPGQAQGGYLIVYYAFFDQDANTDWGTGDDDQFSFVNTDPSRACELGTTSRRLCRRTFRLNDMAGPRASLTDHLWNPDDGTGVDVMISVMKQVVK